MTETATARRYGHHIDGETVEAESTIERHAPATGELIATYADGSRDATERAIGAARRAFDEGPWPRLAGLDRGRVLSRLAQLIREHAEELARIDADEVGKPIRIARGDIDGAAGHCEYAAGLAAQVHGDSYTNLGAAYTAMIAREPAGVAGLIIPWNFPALILCQKLPYALAAGCTVVVKPSEYTSGSALEIARLAEEAGVPPGVVNVVTGYGDPVGQALVDSYHVDLVSFTGSTVTGRRVAEAAARTTKRVSLELGSKAANIVFADADLDDAIDAALFAVYFNSGECCVSGARLLVEDRIADDFIAEVMRRAQALTVGPPSDERSDVGSLTSEQHLAKVLDYIRIGAEEGAELVLGGGRMTSGQYEHGLFVEPTIFDRVRPEMRIFREEIFGPVLGITRFSGVDEAIKLANATDYGLANSVWTKNIDTALRVARELRSGTVWVNTTIDGGPQLPLGGVKASGHGREMGQAGLEEFTELKTVLIRTGSREPFFDSAQAR